MTVARDRADRKGSTPVQIGTTKLDTDSGDLKVLDTSNNRKKIIASELHIGDGSNQVIIKKGSDNKVAFQTQASGGSAADSNAGGGVTVVADTTALQALSGTAVGDLAFNSGNSKLYLRTSSGWYTVATVTNATPVISSAGNASYDFATDGTPIVITVSATDSEGETITYGHQVTSGSASGIATITQGTGGNVNQFTLTPQQSGSGGTFSVKFSATDPNSNIGLSSASAFTLTFTSYSYYFNATSDGTTDYIHTTNTSSDFTMGTGDFTVECWYKSHSVVSSDWLWQISTGLTGFETTNWADTIAAGLHSSDVRIYGGGVSTTGAVTISPYVWYHIAQVRASGTMKVYVDGVEKISISDTENYDGTRIVFGGSYSTAYLARGRISNLRVVKGTAVYTSNNFTVPTAQLTAISGTVLLTAKSATITDTSSSSHALTSVGSPKASPVSFTGDQKYALRLAGSNDWIHTASTSSDFAFGTGDFTVECWFKTENNLNIQGLFQISTQTVGVYGDTNATVSMAIHLNTIYGNAANAHQYENGVPFLSNRWYHMSYVRASGTTKMYVDGVEKKSVSDTYNYSSNQSMAIGAYIASTHKNLTGTIYGLRVVKGTAVYTSNNFTVPTTDLTAITNTKFLQSTSASAVTDSSDSSHSITVSGDGVTYVKDSPF